MTIAEKILWSRLKKKQIDGIQFYRQKPVANFILDFYVKSPKLAIEVDGGIHNTPAKIEYDANRDLALNELGFTVLHFTNEQVIFNIDHVIKEIRYFLRPLSKGEQPRSGGGC